jgi:hypothetical protein
MWKTRGFPRKIIYTYYTYASFFNVNVSLQEGKHDYSLEIPELNGGFTSMENSPLHGRES